MIGRHRKTEDTCQRYDARGKESNRLVDTIPTCHHQCRSKQKCIPVERQRLRAAAAGSSRRRRRRRSQPAQRVVDPPARASTPSAPRELPLRPRQRHQRALREDEKERRLREKTADAVSALDVGSVLDWS
eukprot:31107-Pelagococcus_subviridis.AAC.5